MTVRKLASNPNNVHRAKPIFAFLHEYESRYGDLGQVISLENRMRELFPENQSLEQFSHRYSTPTFDPTAVRPILSPSQTRPKAPFSTEAAEAHHNGNAPIKQNDISANNSPKRGPDEFDEDSYRPRKFVRAESPLKTTQSRRAEQQKRVQQANGGGGGGGQPNAQFKPQASPFPIPRDVVSLLSIIPPAHTYHAGRFSPEKLVELLRRIDIPY